MTPGSVLLVAIASAVSSITFRFQPNGSIASITSTLGSSAGLHCAARNSRFPAQSRQDDSQIYNHRAHIAQSRQDDSQIYNHRAHIKITCIAVLLILALVISVALNSAECDWLLLGWKLAQLFPESISYADVSFDIPSSPTTIDNQRTYIRDIKKERTSNVVLEHIRFNCPQTHAHSSGRKGIDPWPCIFLC